MILSGQSTCYVSVSKDSYRKNIRRHGQKQNIDIKVRICQNLYCQKIEVVGEPTLYTRLFNVLHSLVIFLLIICPGFNAFMMQFLVSSRP